MWTRPLFRPRRVAGFERVGSPTLSLFASFFASLLLLSTGPAALAAAPETPGSLERQAETDAAAGEEPAAPTAVPAATRLEAIVVRGREDSLVGVVDAASVGTVGHEQLEDRPILRPGEILETVPGLIVTQHSGDGKANQFFLRGFNLDHGTDFASSIDGVPINLVSHGHGQGYTDLNFVIPELVERIDYRKGPYFADQGDFSTAGAADLRYFKTLPGQIAQVEAGMFEYARGLAAGSVAAGKGDFLYGIELLHDNGPWDHPNHFKKLNGVLRYSLGDDAQGASVTASGYAATWDATDQIAERAVGLPGFDRFDSLDPSDGGNSQKVMLYGEWHRNRDDQASRAVLYGFYQNLNLYSNFTYALDSPDGDQFKQLDERWVGGGSARHTWFGDLFGFGMENSTGVQLRSDSIRNGLLQTVRRKRRFKPDYDGGIIPATTRRDDIWELSLGPWVENRIQWHEKLRTIVGLRFDYFHFDVDSDLPGSSGTEEAARWSPKGSVVVGPWAETELYLSGGMGFHSNDARGVTDPVEPADPLVKTYGAEVGVRSAWVPGLHSTVAFWWLEVDSELLFVGDAGTTEATRPSRRYGVELTNYYDPTPWLTFDIDYSWSHARFRDDDPAGDHIPGSVENVVAAGATLHDLDGLADGLLGVFLRGFTGELRLRYFGPRPLIEDDSVRSDDTILLNTRLAYQLNETWGVSFEIFNLLDRDDSEIDYYYPSRLPGEPAGPDEGGYDDVHFHPVAPISFRAGVTARF